MSTASVLLKESDIPEACLAERKPADLRKLIFSFRSYLSVIVKAACKTMICFLMFSSNDADPLPAIINDKSEINTNGY